MKLLIIFCLLIFSLSASAQYPNDAELQKIIDKIVSPMEANEIDSFFEHVTFPFKAGDKKYSESELRAAFSDVFVKGTTSCLKDAGSYQMAMPDDHSWYMAVCFSAPEGYEVSVFVFKKINDKWMLESIDLQND
ncbi:MAG: hypothetical protein QNK23_18910 [Crocinitomicaceae bacterium]|nr:hypothetical protein [Crocinitomicaceae bacterium]